MIKENISNNSGNVMTVRKCFKEYLYQYDELILENKLIKMMLLLSPVC